MAGNYAYRRFLAKLRPARAHCAVKARMLSPLPPHKQKPAQRHAVFFRSAAGVSRGRSAFQLGLWHMDHLW